MGSWASTCWATGAASRPPTPPAAITGVDIAGKTGTAEFGSGNPPPTHAWFLGIRGDNAVAVLIEGGGVGGRVAAPVAGAVLAGLPDT